MGSFSFKHVGQTKQQIAAETTVVASLPISIKTPVQVGGDDSIMACHYSLTDSIHDNLRNLLLTNWGERLTLYDFGANLRPLLMEFTTHDDFDSSAIERIKTAVSKWMPFVELEDFESEIDRTTNKNTGVVKVSVTYNVPLLNVTRRQIQIVLYVV